MFMFNISEINRRLLFSNSAVGFGRDYLGRTIWTTLREGDSVILAYLSIPIQIYCCAILRKGVSVWSDILPPKEEPFYLYLKVEKQGILDKVSHARLKGFINTPFPTPADEFNDIWQKCHAPNVTFVSRLFRDDFLNSNLYDGYRIEIGCSKEDDNFIMDSSETHPFGYIEGFLPLIAFDKNNKRVAALVLEYGDESSLYHRAERRLFGFNRDVRSRSVMIKRIFTEMNPTRKFPSHRALIKASCVVSQSLHTDYLSLIYGISYDFHPMLVKEGFCCEKPNSLSSSFFYWKPFYIPSHQLPECNRLDETMNMVHDVLAKRKSINYWMVSGPEWGLSKAEEHQGWPLKKSENNNGKWRAIKPGDVVFLTTNWTLLRGYGIVAGTANRNVLGLESFPLWIDFHEKEAFDLAIDISKETSQAWFRNIRKGGIVEIFDEYGDNLKRKIDMQKTRGKMLVRPNPYLLPTTQFTTDPMKVFVIQSWTLRNSVYPVLKDILERQGYKVTHAQDRDGQVLFNDIWLMLNEAKAVIVDFTEKRPNVYLEYGMALVLGKAIVAITQDSNDIPSDSPNLRYIKYEVQ